MKISEVLMSDQEWNEHIRITEEERINKECDEQIARIEERRRRELSRAFPGE